MAELPSGWNLTHVREVAGDRGLVGGPFGSSLGTKDYVDDGVPVIRGGNLASDGHFDSSDFVYVSDEKADSLARNIALPGDLVLTQRGTLGQVGLVPEGIADRFVISQSQMRLRCDRSRADERFLYYVFCSPKMLATIDAQAIVTGVPHINLGMLGDFEVLLPPLPEQRAIAEVLGALDDKIESNRRIWNLRLELARSAFRKSAREAEATTPLGELYEVGLSGVWGQDEPSGKATVATSCLRGRDLEDFVAGGSVESPVRFISEKQLSSRVFQNGEIWTAGSGSLGPSLLITEEVARLWHNQLTYSNFVKRLVPIGGHDMAELAWNAIVDAWRNDGFAAFRTGTAMPNLDPSALLAGVQVPLVANETREEVALLTNAALDPEVLRENQALAQLRDTLLPALLSGRIRVPVAAELVEAS